MQKGKPIFLIGLLILVCVVVYFNTLSNEFVFDDRATIVENKYLPDFKGSLPAFFSSAYFEIAEAEASYRPVATLSYYVFYAIGELNPFWYHLGSLILHILNVLLVYFLTLAIQKDQSSAFVAGLLFACHPAVTEAVNCISFNEDLLAAMFYLASFLLYIRTAPSRKTPAVTESSISVSSLAAPRPEIPSERGHGVDSRSQGWARSRSCSRPRSRSAAAAARRRNARWIL